MSGFLSYLYCLDILRSFIGIFYRLLIAGIKLCEGRQGNMLDSGNSRHNRGYQRAAG